MITTTKPKKTGRKEKTTPKLVIAALRASAGIQSAAAQELGVSRSTISNYIARYPKVAEAYAEIDERTLDVAEGKLKQAINAGDLRAVMFILRCKGKKRGYVERREIVGADESEGAPPIQIVISPSDAKL